MKMVRGIALRLQYEVIVRDKKGKVLSREKRSCKSLVTNFVRWLRIFATVVAGDIAPPTVAMNDTGNIGRTVPYGGIRAMGAWGGWLAPVNIDAYGIAVGTSNQAVEPADYNLVGKIAQGTGAGQMVYGAQSVEAVLVVGSVSSWRNTRVFTNNSGSLITVREIGFIFGIYDTGNAIRYFLGCRDVLAVSKEVPDGSTITVRYTVSVSA